MSPSLGREWIEICRQSRSSLTSYSLPPWGGSGLKLLETGFENVVDGLPPWGGSGLKSSAIVTVSPNLGSPSLGREWIEIKNLKMPEVRKRSLPPWGGSGLK